MNLPIIKQTRTRRAPRLQAIVSVTLMLIIGMCFNVLAQGPAMSVGDATKAAKKVVNPKFKIDNVVFVEELGMYRVTVNNSYMHMTPDMKYAFVGDVIDVQKGQSILYTPKPISFSSLPLQDAIQKGDGPYKVAIFIDMRCSYCHKLYQELANIKDVTMYIYLLPFMGNESRSKAEQIWFSADRTKALDTVIIKNESLPAGGKGDGSFLDRNLKLARSLNIRSTPTMVYVDGSSSVGYQPAEKLHTIIASKGNK